MDVNSKMTALADEIRELSGTTTTKSIDTMTADVDAANAEITEQSELLEQIVIALENKAAGGSGEDVTEETTAYTTKINQLETAVTALENELEGKVGAGLGPKLVKVYHDRFSRGTAYYINADYEIVTIQSDSEADVLGGIILYWGNLGMNVTGDYAIYNTGCGRIIKFNNDNGQFSLNESGGSDD
jgi:polyhydroxyalkanoate synthesis regulator phasin